jgi:murein DD-endopeptidase MepM/ murein hydrolase activator NlpD
MTVRSLIRPGDILRIPSADGVLHTIAKNETVSKIAKLYGVAVDDILKANNIQQSALKVGQEILVPGATKLPTQVATTPKNTNNKPTPVKLTPKNTQPSQSGVSTAGYIWPSGARIITQYYGLRHTGVDIAGPIGLPNYAARSGTVIKSQCGYNGGYGCYIILDHGDGVQTLYGHNSQLLVSPGEYVLQGQVIGLLGSTGRSTGPHLHFEVRVNGHRANPLQFIRR